MVLSGFFLVVEFPIMKLSIRRKYISGTYERDSAECFKGLHRRSKIVNSKSGVVRFVVLFVV